MMLDFLAILEKLSCDRPIFHSEADFQHALAWALNTHLPDVQVRLELKPFPDERFYVDIWLVTPKETIAIELKYATRRFQAEVGGEHFSLNNHGAQDLRRYDFVKDLTRVERMTTTDLATVGYAVLLTNDPSYWTRSRNPRTIDSAFRLHEGQRLAGRLAWDDTAGSGTTRGREEPLVLRGEYQVTWTSYSTVGHGPGSEFRFLLVAIDPE